MSFIGILETIGKDFAKGLKFAITYAVPVEKLVALLFPVSAPAVATLLNATTLIQDAVMLVEQKFAAANQQTGTGPQKLDEVLTLTQATVTQLLATAGITANTAYVTSLVNAVVAILNVQPAPAAATK